MILEATDLTSLQYVRTNGYNAVGIFSTDLTP